LATYRYRAATLSGQLRTGTLQGSSTEDALSRIRGLGLMPIETTILNESGSEKKNVRPGAATRTAVARGFSELAVLLGAGLTLDRALRICIENLTDRVTKAEFERLSSRVKEGVALSVAIQESKGVLPPLASAMAEAGEASGTLEISLAKLAEMLERAEALRQTIVSALVYPAILIFIAVSVILIMLLWIVPQFESLFSSTPAKLPPMTEAIITASHLVKNWGLVALAALAAFVIAGMQFARRPAIRLWLDTTVLALPMFGSIVRKAETARFSRTLGSLVDGGVPLPVALSIAGRTMLNTNMSQAAKKVAVGLKEGGGLSRPLQDTGIFPPIAMSFMRTGEETARLGTMLQRLADVLDRDVRTAIERAVAVLTPAITIVMGAVVATVIASIMTGILGFNDLAIGP
jgi:general secretion pathway protein F